MFGFGNKDTAEAKIRVNYDGKRAERGLKGLKAIAATVITAAIIKKVALYTIEIGKLGAQANVVAKNFKNMAALQGRSVGEMMGKLRKATMGMVSDMDLQQQAMKAMIGGVSFDDMITSMEFVTKFAASTGVDATEKINTVMTGLARKSAAFLDDVGIQVTRSSDVVGDAIAQMKDKMGQFATSEEDAFVKTNRLTAELENQKAIIGKELQPAWEAFVGFMGEKAVPAIGKLAQITIQSWSILLKGLFTDETFQGAAADVLINNAKATKSIDTLNAAYANLKSQLTETYAELVKSRGDLRKESEDPGLINSVNAYASEVDRLEDKAGKLIDILDKIDKARKSISGDPPKLPKPPKPPKPPDDPDDPEAAQRAKDAQSIIDAAREEVMRQTHEGRMQLLNEQATEEKITLMAAGAATQENLATINKKYEQLKNQEIQTYQNERFALIKAGYETEFDALKEEIENEEQLREDARRKDLEAERKVAQEKRQIMQQYSNAKNSMYSAMTSFSDAQTSQELANARRTAKSREELQKKEREIMSDAAQRRAEMAIFQQAISVAETIAASSVAIAEATAGGASAGGPLAAITAIASGLSVAASVAGLVAAIEAADVPPPPSFALGRIGQRKRGRGADNIAALIQEGESIVPPAQSAMHEDEIRAIVNNTANTASGLRRITGGNVTMNYFGVTTEAVLQSQEEIRRRGLVGKRI